MVIKIKTIMPDNNPIGIKIDDITSRIPKLTLLNRDLIDKGINCLEDNLGIYFLVDIKNKEVYVGKSIRCLTRLNEHNKGKKFWHVALIISFKDVTFSSSHIEYLEYYCYNLIKSVKRYSLKNKIMGNMRHVPEEIKQDVEDIFDDIKTLLYNRGFIFFEPSLKKIDQPKQEMGATIAFLKAKSGLYNAKLVITNKKFIVLKGSKAILQLMPSGKGRSVENRRNKLVEKEILIKKDNYYIFTKDYEFKTPSGAGEVIKGGTSNGWADWKLENGEPIQVIRKKLNEL
jgi:hypothetical protein